MKFWVSYSFFERLPIDKVEVSPLLRTVPYTWLSREIGKDLAGTNRTLHTVDIDSYIEKPILCMVICMYICMYVCMYVCM